ncbi:hypothetical protein [Bradyrhizobium sp. CCGUVB14]|uniref:hypothetical protein n=1 Tax=Bradyrhizobium sp. CCGUVB14 TaxID=2949628 RepID=UPI0020B2324A|nr:hypothetical protein [Bradyrhizobium sp. CCGUVB14]MCP3444107.1 hypothetical protein [Bradyrhizobium sp. CCGUVB14]
MPNETPVFYAFAVDPATGAWKIWMGTGTREAIAAAGYRTPPKPFGYCSKSSLKDGWGFRFLHIHDAQ